MKDRDYDIAYLEIKLKNDELEQEWYLWKLGRRGELLNASERPETAPNQAEAANAANSNKRQS